MTRDEKRMIRREYINFYLQHAYRFLWSTLSEIMSMVRLLERLNYDQELKVY